MKKLVFMFLFFPLLVDAQEKVITFKADNMCTSTWDSQTKNYIYDDPSKSNVVGVINLDKGFIELKNEANPKFVIYDLEIRKLDDRTQYVIDTVEKGEKVLIVFLDFHDNMYFDIIEFNYGDFTIQFQIDILDIR